MTKLNDIWSLWYSNSKIRKQSPVFGSHFGEFSAAETFWEYYNNIFIPERLESDMDISMFRSKYANLEDSKEDEYYELGPRIVISVTRKNHYPDPRINDWAQKIMLLLIGETIADESGKVNGVIISARKVEHRMVIMIDNIESELTDQILERVKLTLELPSEAPDISIKVIDD